MAEGHRSAQATGQMFVGGCTLSGVQYASVAAATITMFDNAAAAAGTVLFEKETGANDSDFIELPDIEVANGIHVVITGAADVVVLIN